MNAPMRAKKVKKVVLYGYYNLNGEYLVFDDNPLHGKTFSNVNVSISRESKTVAGSAYLVDVIAIEGCETIECELVGYCFAADGTLEISICQDWG